MWHSVILTLGLLMWSPPGHAHLALAHNTTGNNERLPTIGRAPDFSLTSQDGARVSLGDFHGKVLVVTFIFTSCTDTCPLLTAKMAPVQDALGADFGARIAFVSITVDPERDTPRGAQRLCEDLRCRPQGLGVPDRNAGGDRRRHQSLWRLRISETTDDVNHTFLTSLIDQDGNLRVQYLGVRFDPEEFRRDLVSLLGETH